MNVEMLKKIARAHPWLDIDADDSNDLHVLHYILTGRECPVSYFGCEDFQANPGDDDQHGEDEGETCTSCMNFDDKRCILHPNAIARWFAETKSYHDDDL